MLGEVWGASAFGMTFRSFFLRAFIAILFSAVKHCDAAPPQADPADPIVELNRLCMPEQAVTLKSHTGRSPFSHFQFEIRMFLPGSPKQDSPSVRIICEANGGDAAMLMLTPDGLPYALFGPNEIFVCSDRDEKPYLRIPRVKMQADVGSSEIFPVLKWSTGLETCSCVLDVPSIVSQLAKEKHTCTYSAYNRTFDLKKENNSHSRIRFNREATRWSFRVAELSVKNSEGEGYEVTNIQAAPRIVRSILEMHEQLATKFSASILEVKPTQEICDQALPLADAAKLRARFNSPLVHQAALNWADAIQIAPVARREMIAEATSKLAAALADDNSNAVEIEPLVSLLFNKLISDVEMGLRSAKDESDMVIIAGLDPTANASRMECLFGGESQRAIQNLLSDVASSPKVNEISRVMAMETLGRIGLTEREQQIEQLRRRVTSDTSPAVKAMLAAIAVRNAVASEDDIERLRDTIGDPDVLRDVRLLSMEALLLADATAGLRSQFEDLFEIAEKRPQYLAWCQLAAGCSSDGRAILIKSLSLKQDRDLMMPLSALVGQLKRSDADWNQAMSICKKLSLNKQQGFMVRRLSGQIAAADDDDGDYRDEFIRTALSSENFSLIDCAIGKYLLTHKNPYAYFDELALAFNASSTGERMKILGLLAIRCTDPVPAEHVAAYNRFVQTAKTDRNRLVVAAVSLLEDRQTKITK